MKFLNGGNVIRLPLDQIAVEGRLREVREQAIENLMLMAQDTGITTPIHVRKVQGRYVLIDGAHRLEVSRRLGLADIAALVLECRADEARAMEASNNLGVARMTPLQTAVFVASWKRDYYAMHPDRAPGTFKGNQHTGNLVGINLTLTRTIADAFGVSEPTIKRALQAGERLTPEEAAQLDSAPGRVTMEDLKALAKIADPEERSAVVLRLASGNAKSAAAARKSLRVEAGVEAPVKDPVDTQFRDLSDAWTRAGAAARKRFLFEFAREIWHAQNSGAALNNWSEAADETAAAEEAVAAE
ncbi:ParB/RepB/Spo0J family partition protein [Frigidibacter oleivorans]|uniref:ParB/RepB/Spo0J family partition protein n=1 Tax=Frigidibacter oleivorans TaxID=2487129 RepID=UPI000F8D3D46|nr:ParB N-terminal domain-containing protein [Frigidibacter oleivorans]